MLKEHGEKTIDGRWRSAAADRNWQAISEIVEPILPSRGSVVEVASGTGQHIVRFAMAYPHLQWQPTEPDKELRQSILREIELSSLSNIETPLSLDVRDVNQILPSTKLIFCVNMLHVAPYDAIQGLVSCASSALEQSGYLFIYGPFKHQGEFNSAGRHFERTGLSGDCEKSQRLLLPQRSLIFTWSVRSICPPIIPASFFAWKMRALI